MTTIDIEQVKKEVIAILKKLIENPADKLVLNEACAIYKKYERHRIVLPKVLAETVRILMYFEVGEKQLIPSEKHLRELLSLLESK